MNLSTNSDQQKLIKNKKEGKRVTPTWLTSVDIFITLIYHGEKIKTGSFQPTLWLSTAEVDSWVYFYSWWKTRCWLKAFTLYLFTVIHRCFADVYIHESGMCRTFPFFSTYLFFCKLHTNIPGSETSPFLSILDKECSTVFYYLLSLLSRLPNIEQLLAIA